MPSKRDADAGKGMLSFDEETGRRIEAIYLTRDAALRRRALRTALRLQPGQHGLYIGSGPGTAPCEMARALGPQGRLSVVEKSPAMLALTRRRAGDEGLLDRLDLREGDAVALPFPEEVFAFVGSAQVFEYVPEVDRAVAEAWRVLQPGGRLALVDTDWRTLIWHVGDAALGDRVEAAWEGHLADNHLPRRLKPLLVRAGFRVERVEPVVILNTGEDPDAFSLRLLPLVADYVRGTGRLSGAEIDDWTADVHRQFDRGTYFFSLNQYLFQAHKPG